MDAHPELPPDIAAFVCDHAPDVLRVLAFFARSAPLFALVVTMERLALSPDAYVRWAGSAERAADIERDNARAGAYMGSSLRGACGRCYSQIVYFPDAQALNWPWLDRHDCVEPDADHPCEPQSRQFMAQVCE